MMCIYLNHNVPFWHSLQLHSTITRMSPSKSNIKQVANILFAQTNSASYPLQNRNYGVKDLLVLQWLTGAVVSLLAAPCIHSN